MHRDKYENSVIDCLLGWDLELPRVNGIDNIVRWLAVYCAADALSGSQDLLHAAREFLREGF